MNFGVVINRKAGAALGRSSSAVSQLVVDALEPLGSIIEQRTASGREIAKQIEAIAGNDEVDTLVAAGGDGTVSLAAQHAIATGKRLLPIPFGTFNLFSRSLGWGGDPLAALGAIAHGEPATVDVATVNGLVFVHHVSCGLHPRYIRVRDAMRYSTRIGKVVVGMRAIMRTIRTTPTRRIHLALGGNEMERRAVGLAVTVNRLAEVPGEPPVPTDPAGGALAVYLAHGESRLERVRLIANALRGRWEHNPSIETWDTDHATVSTLRRRIPVSVDGELMHLEPPLDLVMMPDTLKVIRPARPVGHSPSGS